MLAWEGAPCIPTYHADGCTPISEAQVVEPTQGCGPSTAHLLPSCPALAVDQRQATRPGTRIMMAIAVPSLSCPNSRVQFGLMLFPADKIQTSSFYLLFPLNGVFWRCRMVNVRSFSSFYSRLTATMLSSVWFMSLIRSINHHQDETEKRLTTVFAQSHN